MTAENSPHAPLICAPEEKARLEARNAVKQIAYITYVVNTLGARELRESHIRELQQLAVEGIYPCGGTLRNARDEIYISDGDHKPPDAAEVKNLVTDLVEWVNAERKQQRHEIECASYALWRLNWIHPFRGGNGRTARMIAYMIICMGMGHMLPGTPSIPKQIYNQRDAYIEALRAVDADLRAQIDANVENPIPNFTAMREFLYPMIEHQMEQGVLQGELLEKMTEALSYGTGRVELNVEAPVTMPGAENLALLAELDKARTASIHSGHRVARLLLHENDHVRKLAPRRHDGETGVSNEQALELMSLGAKWVGHDHYRPA